MIEVTLNPDTWDNRPRPEPGKPLTVTLRAVYEVKDTAEAKEHDVWTGKVVSEAKQYTFW